jgi:predicted TIM-barrel fold metal-dependent hydrolase
METFRIPAYIEAIDVHVHPATQEAEDAGGEYLAWAKKLFKDGVHEVVSFDETAAMYRAHNMMCVLLGIDSRTNTGLPAISNDVIAQAVREHPDTFIGFGSVDPHMGKWAVNEVHRIAELGLRGLKFQPIVQGFFPDDERFYPIYAAARELGLAVLFHTGTTGIGAGAPGGMGLKLKYGRPIHLDDVAADFPDLTIIAAHPGAPWTEELLAVAVHKANVYVDMSGWAPKYFPTPFVHDARTRLQDKMLFGTDWPLISIERWQHEFAAYDFPQEVVRKIMLGNAMRALKLEFEPAAALG